jgi:hypothetical protein
MSTSADFFRTEMLWTLSSDPYSEIIKIPSPRGQLTPDQQQERRDAFNRIINDIIGKMVPEFRDENRKNYRFLRRVNVVTILIGIALLISSLVIGIINNNPNFAAVIGGIAIADFVAIFLVNPQSRITGLLKDFGQYELIFARWSLQLKAAFELLLASNWSDADVKRFQDALETYTASAIKDIETYIGKE